MQAAKDNSPQLGPIWSLIAGGMLFIAGAGLDILSLLALWKGEIWRFSKRHSGLVVRAEHPGEFWYSFVASLVIGSMLVLMSRRLLKEGWKKQREEKAPGA